MLGKLEGLKFFRLWRDIVFLILYVHMLDLDILYLHTYDTSKGGGGERLLDCLELVGIYFWIADKIFMTPFPQEY